MAEAELKIKLVKREIETRADAFWFGFSEAAGKLFGAAFTLGLIWLVLRLTGVLPLDLEEPK